MIDNIPFNSGAIRASDCISDAWELIKDRYWLFWGMMMLGIVLVGCIPCVNIFVTGPLMVGVVVALLAKMRNDPVNFEMLFKGFDKFVNAMVVGLIVNVPGIISTILQFTFNITDAVLKNRGRDFDFFAPNDIAPAVAGGLIVLVLVIVFGFLLFSMAWHITFMFALPLLAEHDLSIGGALSLSARAGWSNTGGIVVLVILQVLLGFVGILALCIGIYFVFPVIVAANVVAYRMVFPPVTIPSQYSEPPKPEYYGGSFGNS